MFIVAFNTQAFMNIKEILNMVFFVFFTGHKLIYRWSPLSVNHCLQPLRHSINQFNEPFTRNPLPNNIQCPLVRGTLYRKTDPMIATALKTKSRSGDQNDKGKFKVESSSKTSYR